MAERLDIENQNTKNNVSENQDKESVQKENMKTPDTENKIETKKKKENKGGNAPKANKDGDVPVHIEEILRMFNNYEKLYIDKQGGVFPEDTDSSLIEGLILYYNPYFKQ